MEVDLNKGSSAKKVAFVLSGGGNRGALEVGVLLALLEHDVRPHILVGNSVGAINAAAVAVDPTFERACWLAEVWRGVTRKDVMPNNFLSMVWRLVTREGSLFTNQNLRSFLESHLPEGIRQFVDIKTAELYITAVGFNTNELHVFGIDRSESILDAMMASTALPLLLPPWQYRGREYVDGAIVSDLPVRVAVEMGAVETYAIDVGQRRMARRGPRAILRIVGQTMDAAAYQGVGDELDWARKPRQGDIHYVAVEAFQGLRVWDFSHTVEMIETGKQVALEHLRQRGLV